MIINPIKKITGSIYVLLLCSVSFSFAAPVINIQDIDRLNEAQRQHEHYFQNSHLSSYLLSYMDKESYSAAEQFEKLLDAGVIAKTDEVTDVPGLKIDEIFASAFRSLNISTTEELEFLLNAFTSPIYQRSPNLELLISLYKPVAYGSATQAEMHSNAYLSLKSRTLWFLGNFPGYLALGGKPHIQKFLAAIYANRGYPALYNPPHSHFFSALTSSGNDWGDVFSELGHALLWAFSCNSDSEEFNNEITLLESCKVDKYQDYKDLKGLEHDQSYLLVSTKDSGSPESKTQLTPAPGYFKEFADRSADYSLQSLRHVMHRVVEDKTEGAQFFVLFRGADKYQFFTVGIYQNYLSLAYVVDDHPPTPILSYLIPLKGMDLEQVIDGIHAMLHQSKSTHDMVPDLQGVWMISSQ